MAKPKVRVKINRREWGRQVTGSPGVVSVLSRQAARVAAQVPGAEVDVRVNSVRGGGARANARISYGSNREEANTGRLLGALMRVAGRGR